MRTAFSSTPIRAAMICRARMRLRSCSGSFGSQPSRAPIPLGVSSSTDSIEHLFLRTIALHLGASSGRLHSARPTPSANAALSCRSARGHPGPTRGLRWETCPMARRATVVGSGPNGLAAAVALARAGLEVEVLEASSTIGGGIRTAPLTLPGFRHDVCSAVHPAALSSPFFRAFGLRDRIEWIVPEASFAQPLDSVGGEGRAAIAWRDLDRTAEALGRDARAWKAVV